LVPWEGGRARVGAPKGRWRAAARLAEGRNDVRVIARDAAGNTRSVERRVVVDTTAPTLILSGPPGGARVTETGAPLLYGAVPKDRPESLVFGGAVNGRPFTAVRGADAPTADEAVFAAEAPRIAFDGRRFALSVGTLPEGTSTIRMWARDPAGNIATATTKVNVNSTDIFGGSTLVRGARGEDITTLHGRLALANVYKGKPREVFDKLTEGAVRRYQKRYRLPITGRVDAATRDAMVGRIVVNLTQKKLRLVRDGRVVKTFGVAIGTAAHPSPVGSYAITDLQTNPAWFPPDSPWAAGLGPIPPGPGNPLGTRWIGTSAPAIGIHGTYADSSIGTAASHGCIRMHIPEVEELFDQVAVGMDVEFRV
ncbi:MAG: L,D-transpeptidase family protein, partial [Miltoncostaeaceae bacterium]